jgi:hypothetical protein
MQLCIFILNIGYIGYQRNHVSLEGCLDGCS